jgi:hypothetical protein
MGGYEGVSLSGDGLQFKDEMLIFVRQRWRVVVIWQRLGYDRFFNFDASRKRGASDDRRVRLGL